MDALPSNTSAYFVSRHSRHANNFIPASVAGRYGNGRTGHIQKIRQEFDAGLVRPTVDRRRGQSQFQRIAQFAGDGVFPGPGLNSDREGSTNRRFANRNHEF